LKLALLPHFPGDVASGLCAEFGLISGIGHRNSPRGIEDVTIWRRFAGRYRSLPNISPDHCQDSTRAMRDTAPTAAGYTAYRDAGRFCDPDDPENDGERSAIQRVLRFDHLIMADSNPRRVN
jgi:hypothetical protein